MNIITATSVLGSTLPITSSIHFVNEKFSKMNLSRMSEV